MVSDRRGLFRHVENSAHQRPHHRLWRYVISAPRRGGQLHTRQAVLPERRSSREANPIGSSRRTAARHHRRCRRRSSKPLRYDCAAAGYVPHDQLPRRMDLNIARQVLVNTFIVRISGVPPIAALRAAVREVDPTAAFSSVRTVDEYAGAQLQDLRHYTALLTLFGTISGLLCVIGIFGVMAHAVMQRRNELGIRIALGAPKASVLQLILKQGLVLVGTGMALGLLAAIALTQLIRSFLWGITPTDPVTFVIVSAALTALALIACYVPARRALKIDPIVALRLE